MGYRRRRRAIANAKGEGSVGVTMALLEVAEAIRELKEENQA